MLSEDPPGLSEEKNRSWIELMLKKKEVILTVPLFASVGGVPFITIGELGANLEYLGIMSEMKVLVSSYWNV